MRTPIEEMSMTSIMNVEEVGIPHCHVGSKFRPCPWFDIYSEGPGVAGWGIAERVTGKRLYLPRGWNGEIHPFSTKKEAMVLCDRLNAACAQPAQGQQP
jgi:hypothetical protein